MKNRSLFFIVSLIIISGCSANAFVGKTFQTFSKVEQISLTFSVPTIVDKDTYYEITVMGAERVFSIPGAPLLPSLIKTVNFPFGTQIVDITCDNCQPEELVLAKKITPADDPLIQGKNVQVDDHSFNMDIYESTNFYPPSWCENYVSSGLDHENNHRTFLTLEMFPVRYSGNKDTIQYTNKIDVAITYKESETTFSYQTNTYDMVVITPSLFSDELQPLIHHKNDVGIQTVLKTTEEIYTEYDGRDQAEQIKYFIKDAIETWEISYVLIIGGINLVPLRETFIEHPGGSFDIITDLYYADIYHTNGSFCSWDSDNNNIFGEFYWDYMTGNSSLRDKLDLYPDVKIGRLPCNEKWELSLVVDKIIRYETSSADDEWFKKIILMGGDSQPDTTGIEGEIATAQISQVMMGKGFTPVKLWTSLNTFNPTCINREITKGAGFLCYSGHGLPNGIATYPPNAEKIINYFTPYLFGLFNHNKLPITFLSACWTAQLDYDKQFCRYKIPCFAWETVMNPFGGSICTIGSTRPASTNVTSAGIQWGCDLLCFLFFQAYEPGSSVSDMLTTAQYEYLEFCLREWPDGIDPLTLEMFVLIGDPSLKIGGYVERT